MVLLRLYQSLSKINVPTVFTSVVLCALTISIFASLWSEKPITSTQTVAPKPRKLKHTDIIECPSQGNISSEGLDPVKRFVYIPPPKTGSFITRHELRKFCRNSKLKCISQSSPCKKSQECLRTNPKLAEERKSIFWAAFTKSRFKECCPQILKKQKFHGSMFHFYLADKPTKAFLQSVTYKNSFYFTMLRNPVNQFVSWFNWITKHHRHLYIQYMPFLKTPPSLEEAVSLYYQHVVARKPQELPEEQAVLYNTLNNIQSKVLGFNGTPASLKTVLLDLRDKYSFVGITEELPDSWKILRQQLRLPSNYFCMESLRNTTSHISNLSPSLQQKIMRIQWADMKLYNKAKKLFEQYKHQFLTKLPVQRKRLKTPIDH